MGKPEAVLAPHPPHATPMQRLLDPRSIAFIGASADPKRLGGIAIDHLVDFGYGGAVYPVNPKYPQMHGWSATRMSSRCRSARPGGAGHRRRGGAADLEALP